MSLTLRSIGLGHHTFLYSRHMSRYCHRADDHARQTRAARHGHRLPLSWRRHPSWTGPPTDQRVRRLLIPELPTVIRTAVPLACHCNRLLKTTNDNHPRFFTAQQASSRCGASAKLRRASRQVRRLTEFPDGAVRRVSVFTPLRIYDSPFFRVVAIPYLTNCGKGDIRGIAIPHNRISGRYP